MTLILRQLERKLIPKAEQSFSLKNLNITVGGNEYFTFQNGSISLKPIEPKYRSTEHHIAILISFSFSLIYYSMLRSILSVRGLF